MFNVVLVRPEIPPNTGNIIRLCANTGASLHLVRPLGFPIDHAKMRRAGLDYHEFAALRVHDSWEAFLSTVSPATMYAFTTRGERNHCAVRYQPNDCLVFGSETAGLPTEVLAQFSGERRLRLPMRPQNRSLNLSNSVAIAVYEAWRQHDFSGAGR
jgi:tRNA (cytidine/uridine-2'-O-)-methyltransferase